MKKFEENGFTATVTKDVVRWEIPDRCPVWGSEAKEAQSNILF